MKKIVFSVIVVLMMFMFVSSSEADVSNRLYLVPVEYIYDNGTLVEIIPKYFWHEVHNPTGIQAGRLRLQWYGHLNAVLVAAHAIEDLDHDALILNDGVYAYPEIDQLDNQISDSQALGDAYEGVNVPTDWMTASTTYREFLRQTMSMFAFMNRYNAISQGDNLFEGGDLSTRYRDMTAQQQAWFDATVVSFGEDPGIINPNNNFRQLLKAASDWFAGREYHMGDITI